ncbi:MAG: hypothetical protein N3F04_04415 [Candidatus Nezhaarchaeota archaeon]|nr:hypothetical protein [Candidatus Nezhaarchaeota archaeon]MCX8142004.1 hypothetical protein [Candidatus Nezhaarchaeota archaeon]MDW8050215.1 hypothetical protein [Nitrososphaerota archaeon]
MSNSEGLPKEIILTRENNIGRIFKCKYCGAIYVGLSDAKRHAEKPDTKCLSLRKKA